MAEILVETCRHCGAAMRLAGTRRLCATCLAEACLSSQAEDPATVGGENDADPTRLHPSGGVGMTPSAAGNGRRLGPFGDYEIVEQIGRGGMGVIFKARQASLNRWVAVKMIAAGSLASPEARERFRTEAEAVARLEHPNIVPIHEVGEDEGEPYYVMRLIEGPTLAERLRTGGAMDPREAAGLVATLAGAVHYAHQRGILHRDLKPANVLLDATRGPQITDFGLAKLLESDAGLTVSHAALGTPSYMAPETAAGGSRGATTAADVYSLGAMLFEMLTGRKLFASDSTAEAIRRLMTEEVLGPRSFRPEVPRDLETICLKCLQKEPRRRYGSAEDLAEDLGRWMRGEPILARRVGRVERTWLWCRRNPELAGLTAALIMILTVGSAVALARIAAARELEEEERYFAAISLADAHIRQGEIELAKELLFKCPERFRQWEWGYLARLCHQEMLTIHAATNPATAWTPWEFFIKGFAFDRSGKRLGCLSADGILRVFSSATGETLFQSGSHGREGVRATALAWNPKQDQLAVGFADGEVRIWESEVWGEQLALRGSPDAVPTGVRQLAFSPDGSLIAAGLGNAGVSVWHSGPGGLAFHIATQAGLHPLVPFTADGRRLVAVGGDLEHYDTRDGRRLEVVRPPSTSALLPLVDPNGRIAATVDKDLRVTRWFEGGRSVVVGGMKTESFTLDRFYAYSLDGRLLYTGGDSATAQLYDLRAERLRFSIPNRAYQGVFSPDSRLLATLGSDPFVRIWDVRTGHELLRLKGHVVIVEAVAFSPDNRLVASADRNGVIKLWRSDAGREVMEREYSMWSGGVSGTGDLGAFGSMDRKCELVDLATGGLVRTLESPWQAVVGVDFSPDGKRVATAGSDRCIHVWEVASGSRLLTLRGHTQAVNAVEFSPDGAWVASGGVDRRAMLWDAKTGRLVREFKDPEQSVWRVTFSPDSRLLAGSSLDLRVYVWEIASGRLLHRTPFPLGDLTEVQFTPDGREMITAGGGLRWWDALSGELLREVATSEDLALLRLSPDGERLVVTGAEGWTVGIGQPKVELRDAGTGRLILNLVGHHEVPMFTRFTRDGRIVSGAFDNSVRQWESFPWRAADYSGEEGQTFEERVRLYSQRYWQGRAAREARSLLPVDVVAPPVWKPDRSEWPRRDPKAEPQCIDLTSHFTGLLDQQFHLHHADWHMDNHLGGMPSGLVEFAGIRFDVRGIVVLRPKVPPSAMQSFLWLRYPTQVGDIQIRRRCRRLHFIQAATWSYLASPRKGVALGHYRVHYADGETRELPILYGEDVGDWFLEDGREHPSVDRAVVAWKGRNSWLALGNGEALTYLRIYENPRPDAEIASIDFVSAGEQLAPMLIGLTVE